jgi:hypothetical protein
VWASPAFKYDWFTGAVLNGAGSDGWLGLYIAEYNVADGSFVSVVADLQTSLWSNSGSWLFDDEQAEDSSNGQRLAEVLGVDRDRFYAIWVWGGTDVYGAGFGNPFSGSTAGGDLSVTVPSFTWIQDGT